MDTEDLPFLIAASIGMSFMWIFGGVSMEGRVQREAVKANVAYYTVDENGISKFYWITE